MTAASLRTIAAGFPLLEGLMLHKLQLEQDQLLSTVAVLKDSLRGVDLTDCTFLPATDDGGGVVTVDIIWTKMLAINPALDRNYWKM